MAVLAEALASFEEARSSGKASRLLSLSPDGREQVRANLANLYSIHAEKVKAVEEFVQASKKAYTPALKVMFSNGVIDNLESEEKVISKAFNSLKKIPIDRFDDFSRTLLAEMLEISVKHLEFMRDARWEIMNIRADHRPDSDVLPEMTVEQLRKLAMSS